MSEVSIPSPRAGKIRKRYDKPKVKSEEQASPPGGGESGAFIPPNPVKAKPKEDKQFTHPQGWPRVFVTIHDDQMTSGMEGGPIDNFIQLNGYAFQVQRNERIALPEPVVKMMETLEMSKPYRNEKNEVLYRQVKRFSMTIHGPAPSISVA